MSYKPGYLKLLSTGELERRVDLLKEKLNPCTVCPWHCKVNRFKQAGPVCNSSYVPYITTICDHHGEEPVLSGTNGSGTVFFGGCNLKCVYCQNWQISQDVSYFTTTTRSIEEAAASLAQLQHDKKVHNINFVSPSHFVPQMVEMIYLAAQMGLRVPIVYNTNAYDDLETLRLLEGIVDIYLPDLKYAQDIAAKKYSRAHNYVSIARRAIKEMFRQVGLLQVDRSGIAHRGLIIRHLILPNALAGSEETLRWIAKELSPRVTVSLMSQYYPIHRAKQIPLLSRPIRYSEYARVLEVMEQLGLDQGFIQEMDAPDYYLPDFRKPGHPFEG